jgi:hypothetical protein
VYATGASGAVFYANYKNKCLRNEQISTLVVFKLFILPVEDDVLIIRTVQNWSIQNLTYASVSRIVINPLEITIYF